MTRGKFVLIIADENDERHYYTSTEFNGNMYIKAGYGEEILKTYTSENIQSIEDWKKYVDDFNQKHFSYDNEWMYGEIKEENCEKCIGDIFNCTGCPKENTCKIHYDFENVENLFDITYYKYYSDYTYWLNLTDSDIEVKADNGIVRINSMGGAVFNFDEFKETIWDSGLIDPEDSYDFVDDKDVKVKTLVKKYKYWNLTEEEAEEIINYDCDNREICGIYDDLEDLGKELIAQSADVPGWLEDYINYEDYGHHEVEDNGYYYFEFCNGRIAHLE